MASPSSAAAPATPTASVTPLALRVGRRLRRLRGERPGVPDSARKRRSRQQRRLPPGGERHGGLPLFRLRCIWRSCRGYISRSTRATLIARTTDTRTLIPTHVHPDAVWVSLLDLTAGK